MENSSSLKKKARELQLLPPKKPRISDPNSTEDGKVNITNRKSPLPLASYPVDSLDLTLSPFSKSLDVSGPTEIFGAITSQKKNPCITKVLEDDDAGIGDVSTELKLFENPWKITKKITEDDLGRLSRLMLNTQAAKRHIISHLEPEIVNKIEDRNEEGWLVGVYDIDTEEMYQLVFKYWLGCQCYVFKGGWVKSFASRRKLDVGDVVGLCFDRVDKRFLFSVLERNQKETPPRPEADQK